MALNPELETLRPKPKPRIALEAETVKPKLRSLTALILNPEPKPSTLNS